MDLFREMLNRGDFTGDLLDKSLVQFCFMSLIQCELDTVTEMWNTHKIRPSRNAHVPSGRPVVMYYAPHLWGFTDKLHILDPNNVDACANQAEFRSTIPCDKDVYDLCMDIIIRDNINLPKDGYNAVDLFLHLKHEILTLL
ncbi:hypothetical protein HOLleu_01206 [Holothuria leucospilota]|uniref:Uncharacterized protein n=1 Tax=Holothuria leucospilota TaxID=206669 RepID=A0A9Q1CPM6_HOLLE|nr:hypothetical protein HOLleu_01206 [Holothuria leucospilota]